MSSRISSKIPSAAKSTESRHHPYQKAHFCATRGNVPSSSPLDAKRFKPPTRPAASDSRPGPSSVRPHNRTMRDVYMANIRSKYPTYQPRHDFDVFVLGDCRYKGPEKEIGAWLDDELAFQAAMFGDARLVIEAARDMLSGPGVVTGSKPTPGDAGVTGIFVRQIPDSAYSIRLFPGSASFRQYCLDFVETSTQRPVNSPMKFELWMVGSHTSPQVCGPVRLHSLESAFGHSPKDIAPGEEKFVLTDGMTCVLTRPGHKPVRFTVPTRAHALEP